MPTDHPLTVPQQLLAERHLSGAYLAQVLGLKRQVVNAWLRGAEACPPRRQAQIAVLLYRRPIELFTKQGIARKEPLK